MPDWKERLTHRALREPELMTRLVEIEELDAKCMQRNQMSAGPVRAFTIDDEIRRTQSPDWQAMAVRVSVLCDEVAQMVAGPGDDVEEI